MTKILLTIIVAIAAAVIIPKVVIHDAKNLTTEEIQCAKLETGMLLDNPIERLLIIETSVDGRRDDHLLTSSYTLAGIKYATVELVCGEGSTVTWRRWFEK